MPHISLFNTRGEAFPTFNALQKQPHRNGFCCGKKIIQPLFVPDDRLPNFQVAKLGNSNSVASIEIYDYTDYRDDVLVGTLPNTIFDVTIDTVAPAFVYATTKFTYKGGILSEFENLECAKQYYLKINFNDGKSFFTDIFKIYEPCCLHLFEWSDDCDIGKTNFTDTNYIKQLYVKNCELTEEIRKINVGGIEQADGSVIYREQRADSWVNYIYRFANRTLVSAINAMSVHSYKRFYHTNGIAFDILNTEIATSQVAGREDCEYDISINMLQGNIVTKGFCCDNDINLAPTYNLEPPYAGCDGDLPCPTPINVQITNVTTETAILSFIENGVTVEFSYDGIAWLVAPGSPINLTGLMPCTNYTLYVRSNCGGTFSNILTYNFTTLSTDCEQASSLFVASQTTTSITLQWIPTTSVYATGQVIEWRESGQLNWQGAGLSLLASTYTINGLTQGTSYEIRLKTICTGNCIKESQYLFILFATDDCAIQINQIVDTIDCDSTGASVTIQALNTTGNYTITISNNSYSNTVSNIDFVDTLDFGTYQIAIQDDSCVKLGTLTVSENCNCEAPTALEVITVTDTTATLNWSDANADSYCLEYRDVTAGVWVVIDNIMPPISAYEVTNLVPCTNYEFRVKAKCGVQESEYSNIVQLSTTGCQGGGGDDCTIVITSATTMCQNGSSAIGVTFNAFNASTPNVTVTIDNGTFSQQQTIPTNLGVANFLNVISDGSIYTVTVQDETLPNCNDAVNVQVDTAVQIISSNVVFCDGDNNVANVEVSLNLNGATSYNYVVTDSLNNIIDNGTETTNLLLIENLPENDTYEISIENASNCIATGTFIVGSCDDLCLMVGIGLQNTDVLEVTATLILPDGASLISMDINWGDTTIEIGVTSIVNTWTYVSAGNYTICMTGSYELNGVVCDFDICDSIDISDDLCETCEITFSNIVINYSTITTPDIAGDGSVSFDVTGCDGSNGYSVVAVTREFCIVSQDANSNPTNPNTCNGQKIIFYNGNQANVTLQNLPVIGDSWVFVGGNSFVINALSDNGNTNGTQYEFTVWDNTNSCQGSLQASIFAINNPCNIDLQVNIACNLNAYALSRWFLQYINTSGLGFNVFVDGTLYTTVTDDGTGFQILDGTINPFFPLTIPADGNSHTIQIVDVGNNACLDTVTFTAFPC